MLNDKIDAFQAVSDEETIKRVYMWLTHDSKGFNYGESAL